MYMFLKDRNTISNVHQNPIFLAEHLGNYSCVGGRSVQIPYVVSNTRIHEVHNRFDIVQFLNSYYRILGSTVELRYFIFGSEILVYLTSEYDFNKITFALIQTLRRFWFANRKSSLDLKGKKNLNLFTCGTHKTRWPGPLSLKARFWFKNLWYVWLYLTIIFQGYGTPRK